MPKYLSMTMSSLNDDDDDDDDHMDESDDGDDKVGIGDVTHPRAKRANHDQS